MKLLTRRALAILVLALAVICGILFFTVRYLGEASKWVQHAANQHLYKNGKLKASGTIYDRNGEILMETVDGIVRYHENPAVRAALMHAVGDADGHVVTGARVAWGKRLAGWNLLQGAYRFNRGLSHPGSDIKMTLDAELCAIAYNSLQGRKGAVGVYNYKTGEILCMVSTPTFDPQYPPDIDKDPERYEGVYINRFLSAAYTPGSVFKLVTAAAAIDNLENIDSTVFQCNSKTVIDGEYVTCPTAHGRVDFKEALAKSCNVAFAQIALAVGADTLQAYADKAGFNSSLEVNGIKTKAGQVNLKNAQRPDLAWAGIGQYTNTANPLNLMVFMGTIANDGVRVEPKLIKDSWLLRLLQTVVPRERVLSPETAIRLGSMMRNNVLSSYGEGNYRGLELCAKSGTAEVGGDRMPHAWFAGYMQREDCPLAFVVVVENGGGGSKVAGPIARKVLQAAVSRYAGE
ncbi:MAG: penicillin-binding protein [Syntrophomonadaceae bacterium]|nr:penicillin-binding protein [Syntrophomonadaceae bacterium]